MVWLKGTCYIASSTTYGCDCPVEFHGQNCELDHPCKDKPCVHGTCYQTGKNGVIDYGCSCDIGSVFFLKWMKL